MRRSNKKNGLFLILGTTWVAIGSGAFWACQAIDFGGGTDLAEWSFALGGTTSPPCVENCVDDPSRQTSAGEAAESGSLSGTSDYRIDYDGEWADPEDFNEGSWAG